MKKIVLLLCAASIVMFAAGCGAKEEAPATGTTAETGTTGATDQKGADDAKTN